MPINTFSDDSIRRVVDKIRFLESQVQNLSRTDRGRRRQPVTWPGEAGGGTTELWLVNSGTTLSSTTLTDVSTGYWSNIYPGSGGSLFSVNGSNQLEAESDFTARVWLYHSFGVLSSSVDNSALCICDFKAAFSAISGSPTVSMQGVYGGYCYIAGTDADVYNGSRSLDEHGRIGVSDGDTFRVRAARQNGGSKNVDSLTYDIGYFLIHTD